MNTKPHSNANFVGFVGSSSAYYIHTLASLPLRRLVIILNAALYYMIPGIVLGSTEATYEIPWTQLMWSSINFIIFILILYFVLRYPVINFFKNRKHAIQDHIKKSQNENQVAHQQIEKYKNEIAHLDTTITMINDEMKQITETVTRHLLQEGHNLAAKIKEDAKLHIESEIGKMKDRLVTESLHEIIEDTKKTLQEKMTENDHDNLYKNFLQRDIQ